MARMARGRWIGGALVALVMATAAPLHAETMDLSGGNDFEAAALSGREQHIRNLLAARQFDRALEEALALEKAEPDKPFVADLLGFVYVARGDLPSARKSFERSARISADPMPATLRLVQIDLTEGKVADATKRLEPILASQPNNVEAMIGMAGIAATGGRDADCEAWFAKAINAAPNSARPRVLLVNYYLKWRHDTGRAVAVAQDARVAMPDDPAVLDALGTAQLVSGDAAGALTAYRALASVVRQNAVAQYRVATAEVALRDFAEARASLNRAIALNPDYIDAKILLANVELQARRPNDSLKIAQQVQKDYPQLPAGPMLEGDVLMAQKDYKGARAAYEKALALGNEGPIAIKLHSAQVAAGESKQADERLTAWLARNPRQVQPRAYLATVYARSGRTREALEQYDQLLKVDPYNALALNDVAWLYQQAKDPRALGVAERAYKVMPANPHVMDTLGWILVEKGDAARGVEILRRAVELAPNAPSLRYHLAAGLAKTGDKSQARRELETMLDRNAAFPQRADAEALLAQLKR